MRRYLWLPTLALLVYTAFSALYTVDQGKFVYVTQFGKHVVTHDGATSAGLHVKWPWPIQTLQQVDRRLQFFDLPETELLTKDAQGTSIDKTITVFAYVCWRIPHADAVDPFLRRIGTAERTRTILGERIRTQFGAVLGTLRMEDLLHVDADRVRAQMDSLHAQVLSMTKEQALEQYGIEIVDIRLRRTSHPPQVRDSIFERIRSERFAKASEYRSKGDREAKDLRSKAEAQVNEIKNKARTEKYELERNAEIEASNIRKLALSKDPEFYAWYKKLEASSKVLGDGNTWLWYSPGHWLFKLLDEPASKPAEAPKGGS